MCWSHKECEEKMLDMGNKKNKMKTEKCCLKETGLGRKVRKKKKYEKDIRFGSEKERKKKNTNAVKKKKTNINTSCELKC